MAWIDTRPNHNTMENAYIRRINLDLICDRKMAYLKVLLDEICGRKCFIACNVWQNCDSRDNNFAIGDVHEYVLVYARNPDSFKKRRNLVALDHKSKKTYTNPDGDRKGEWQSISYTGESFRTNQMYEIVAPNGNIHVPPEGRHWASLEPESHRLFDAGRIWFGRVGNGVPRVKRYLTEVDGLVPWTWWPHDDVGHTGESKKESQALFGKSNPFPTPKLERLLERIISIATKPGDIVLDSFAGSGTTGAVAHKMGRPWIMVELEPHCVTHIVPRMPKVVEGLDSGGISGVHNLVRWRWFPLLPLNSVATSIGQVR